MRRERGESLGRVRPLFSGSGVRLYRGDVLRLAPRLPAGSIDGVITDPPYCSGGTTPAERQRDPAAKYCQNGDTLGRPSFAGDTRDQRSFKWWCTCWLTLCREATAVGGRLLVFIDWRQLPTMTDAVQAAGWTWRSVAVWNKGRSARAPHKGYLRHQCEYIIFATNGPCPTAENGPFDGCYDVSVKKADKLHITGKPTELMRQLVRMVPPGGTILDPFGGSGTTANAAALEGRQAITFEISDEYCQVAADWFRRLSSRAA